MTQSCFDVAIWSFYNVVEETEQAAENVSSALFSTLREKWKNRNVDQEEEEEQKRRKKNLKKNSVYSQVTFSMEARSCGEVMLLSPLIKRRQWLACKGLKHVQLTKNTLCLIEYVMSALCYNKYCLFKVLGN